LHDPGVNRVHGAEKYFHTVREDFERRGPRSAGGTSSRSRA
jgi:hypothetical protein